MLYDSHPTHAATSMAGPSILELTWISAKSRAVQDIMKRICDPMLDQLRQKGLEDEVCLADLTSQPVKCYQDSGKSFQLNFHDPCQQKFNAKGISYLKYTKQTIKQCLSTGHFSIQWLCYILHGMLVALHVVLILLLTHHPEHHVVMSQDNPWITTTLSVFLQAFYVVSILLCFTVLKCLFYLVVYCWPGFYHTTTSHKNTHYSKAILDYSA